MATLISSPAAPAAGPGQHFATIEHHVQGRVRIKVPRTIGRPQLLKNYADAFAQLERIQKVSSNSATGCIVLFYENASPEQFATSLEQRCHQERLSLQPRRRPDPEAPGKDAAAEARLLAEHSELARKTMAFFNGLDFEIRSVSGNAIDLNIALVGSLAIFTFMGIGAGASTPMWVTLALFGVNHAVRLQSEGLAAIPAPASFS